MVNSVLATALQNLQAAIEERGARIQSRPSSQRFRRRFAAAPGIPESGWQCHQIPWNRATVIRINAEKGGREWRFSFADNGIGIASEHAELVFAIFKRLHTRKEYAGNGIGLSICKKIVEPLGGRIWVESILGQGATFHFT